MKRHNLCLLTLTLVTIFVLDGNTQARQKDSPLPVRQLRVAVAQIPVVTDIGANIETISRAIDRAAAQKADVLLTPEGSLSGYTHKFDQSRVQAGLIKLLAKAKAADLALVLGTCFIEPDDGLCYNQVRFYDADGKFLGFHSKTLFIFDASA